MKYLINRASAISPREDLDLLVKSKKKLRIKLGIDPTAPDVTLGWYAILRSLRKFQELGHTAVLILGEFTAQVGDPSGKSETRSKLNEDDVDKNSEGVLPIIKNILLDSNIEIVSNKDWLAKLSTSELVNLSSSTTLAQMLERDDFSKRYKDGNPISLMEFFYPLFQGYDSVAVKADIEIGGHDQLWNLMLGREVQKFYGMQPQIAMTFPLLVGTDGKKKMSQSLNNYISVTDTPENIYGKIMSIPDDLMWDYFLMLTDYEPNQIQEFKSNIENGSENPFQIKKLLGELIVTELYNEKIANQASLSFKTVTIDKDMPDDIPNYTVSDAGLVHLPKLLTELGITKSNSDARRLITSGSFKIEGEKYLTLDAEFNDINDKNLQLGKRKYFSINKNK
jgi:tyrosyl-tRNA synthetase